MPTKGAAPIDYSKVFSSQVRKAFTGDENMNVAQGAYTMIRGSAPKNIDGTPMYGTISAAGTKQMKEKAAYKHGMHGDRNEMGKKAMSQKMNDYFPHNNIPAGDTNPNMQKNYLIQDASPVVTMGQYGARQGDETKKYYTKTATTELDNDKTLSLTTVRPHTETKYVHAGDHYGGNPRFMSRGHGGTMKPVKERVEGSVTYVNPKGKEKSAKLGTLKAKALETIYNIRSKQGKFRSTETYSPEEKVYKFKGGKETITRS